MQLGGGLTNNITIMFDESSNSNKTGGLKYIFQQHLQKGKISKGDIIHFLNYIGVEFNKNDINEKMENVNKDFDGSLTLSELFDFLVTELEVTESEDDVLNAFKVFDKNETGFINVLHLKHIMTNLGDQLTEYEVNQLTQRSDLDGDGSINYEELIKNMMRGNAATSKY